MRGTFWVLFLESFFGVFFLLLIVNEWIKFYWLVFWDFEKCSGSMNFEVVMIAFLGN